MPSYQLQDVAQIECIDRHLENIRDIHPDTPVILTSPGLGLSWEEDSGAR